MALLTSAGKWTCVLVKSAGLFTHTVMRTRCMRRRAICTRTKNEAYFIARASPWKRPSNKFALILDYVNSDPVHTIPGIFKTQIMWEGL